MVDAPRWMPTALRPDRVRRMLLCLLTALMLAQTLGVLHRTAHAQESAGITTHAATDTSGVMAVMWGEHSNSAECQLFDHACPDLLHVKVWALHTALPMVTWLAVVLQERFALFERYYATRGPPVDVI